MFEFIPHMFFSPPEIGCIFELGPFTGTQLRFKTGRNRKLVYDWLSIFILGAFFDEGLCMCKISRVTPELGQSPGPKEMGPGDTNCRTVGLR